MPCVPLSPIGYWTRICLCRLPAPHLSRPLMKEKLAQFTFAEHAPYLTESEKGYEGGQHDQRAGKKFIPTGTNDFLKALRYAFPVENTTNSMFENFKRQRKETEQDHLVEGGNDQGPVIKHLDQTHIFTQQNHLRQNECLDQPKPVMTITEAHLLHHEHSVGSKGAKEQGQIEEDHQQFVHLVDHFLF